MKQLQLPFCIRHVEPPCDHRKCMCLITCECPACKAVIRKALAEAMAAKPS